MFAKKRLLSSFQHDGSWCSSAKLILFVARSTIFMLFCSLWTLSWVAMALWARTRMLTGGYLRQVQELYSTRFPMEVRHSIAPWIEKQNWYALYCYSYSFNICLFNKIWQKIAMQLLHSSFFTNVWIWFNFFENGRLLLHLC